MAWCHQTTSHCLSQCWFRSLSPYGITWSQWVNTDVTSLTQKPQYFRPFTFEVYICISMISPIIISQPAMCQMSICYTYKWACTHYFTASTGCILVTSWPTCEPPTARRTTSRCLRQPSRWVRLFHWLYRMYPCHFLTYIWTTFSQKENQLFHSLYIMTCTLQFLDWLDG